MITTAFDHCTTTITPRRCQREIMDLLFGTKAAEKKWYIVCPPGSGKTILGLMVAVRLRVPTLVLAPNTAIQSQWVDKTRFFVSQTDSGLPLASVDIDDNAPITVLTYQALARVRAMTAVERSDLIDEWIAELIDEGDTEDDAISWLTEYQCQNQERFDASLLRRWKRQRINTGPEEDLTDVVDPVALQSMRQLRDRGVKLVIFDECHHLVGYWAQVGLALTQVLDGPKILGLTATPPGESDVTDQEAVLHQSLLGKVDYSLPTPAVVRDGHLAPYQDLVCFTRPTEDELLYVSRCSNQLAEVLQMAEGHPGKTLSAWLTDELAIIPEDSFASVLRRRSAFISAAVRYLRNHGKPVQPRYANVVPGMSDIHLEELADLIGRYASRHLLVSASPEDRRFFGDLNRAFRPLGCQLTEKGLRRCQSTVSRILALSRAKLTALVSVLRTELQNHDHVRALVITDFEKSSATIDRDIEDLLTDESGGAVAAMRMLTTDEHTDTLDPILVTGQTVIVDDDLQPTFEREAATWYAERNLSVALDRTRDGGFYRVTGSGADWNTRTYVAMITELFERGVTRCLVGTRGLLGEGWDSLGANTLIDLTTAATEMTVNQLRGRAIRLNPDQPRKVANNWDLVCLAPEFECGLSDYRRFARKHAKYFGIFN